MCVIFFSIFAANSRNKSMVSEQDIFQRTELLLGSKIMEKIASAKVIVFGIGGVGSWCAESLVRSGIRNITIVDSDHICASNINRQLHATTNTIGEPKTEILKKRLEEINPHANIKALQKIYDPESSDSFELETYDYIIDAIDSISNKIDLIRKATRTNAVLFSSMGAGLKIDPSRIKVAEFWKVKYCPLGHYVRKRIRKGELPAKEFLCVYSDELLENKGSIQTSKNEVSQLTDIKDEEQSLANHDWSSQKSTINGTVAHITAIFGFTLAGLVIQDICKEEVI